MNTNNYISIDVARTVIDSTYGNGLAVSVKFRKANGQIRDMVIEQDEKLLSTVQGIRAKSSQTTKVVCEKCDDGRFQFRSIPLDRVLEIKATCA